MESRPPSFWPWFAGLLALQIGLSGVVYLLSSWLHGTPTGGMTLVGHFLGAQTLGALLEHKHAGALRPWRNRMAVTAMTFQVALILVFVQLYGLPPAEVSTDPKKRALLALFLTLGTSILSYGLTWIGLTSGCRVVEKQRRRR